MRSGLVEGSVLLWADFKISKAHTIPGVLSLCLLLGDKDISSHLLLQLHACLPASMLLIMIMDFCNYGPQIKHFCL